MLKWLVTRGPSSPTPHPREEVTDDPLATLKITTSSKKNQQQVYAVSRFNPLYEDEDAAASESQVPPEPPESPPTDRGSVRSSGYGSKETDSVSDHSEGQDEEDAAAGRGGAGQVLAAPGGRALATLLARNPHYVSDIQVGVRRARSLEGLAPIQLPMVPRAATVPRPVWPRVSKPLLPLRPPPAPSVDLVTQDSRFVTAITMSPSPPSPSPVPPSSSDLEAWGGAGRYWGGDGGGGAGQDWGSDSLVTEETLAMMHQSHHQAQQENQDQHQNQESHCQEPIVLRAGVEPVMPHPREPLAPPRTISMVARGPTRPPLRPRRRSFDTGRPGGAVAVTTALWEKSGLKTNGRKLVVSLHHLAGNQSSPTPPPSPPPRLAGLDNPAFLPDPESPQDPEADKMAEFERRVCERLGGAPPHRTQWLDLGDGGGRGTRHVTFTPDTHSPHPQPRRPPSPAVGQEGTGAGITRQQGIWTTSLSYHTRRQEEPGMSGSAGGRGGQELWERYYGACGGAGDKTLPRHLAPHPNSGAPICEQTSTCHDFTLDLRRADKLRRLTESQKKRRRCCSVVLVLVALTMFLAVVVAVSLYYTSGKRFFGPM